MLHIVPMVHVLRSINYINSIKVYFLHCVHIHMFIGWLIGFVLSLSQKLMLSGSGKVLSNGTVISLFDLYYTTTYVL